MIDTFRSHPPLWVETLLVSRETRGLLKTGGYAKLNHREPPHHRWFSPESVKVFGAKEWP